MMCSFLEARKPYRGVYATDVHLHRPEWPQISFETQMMSGNHRYELLERTWRASLEELRHYYIESITH